jgi:hypothetical protein
MRSSWTSVAITFCDRQRLNTSRLPRTASCPITCLFIQGQADGADTVRFVKRAKQTTAFQFKATHKRKLWDRGWFDRILRESDDAQDVLRYLLNNPVRGGLVENAAYYPFSGSGVVSREALFESAFDDRASLRGDGPEGPSLHVHWAATIIFRGGNM